MEVRTDSINVLDPAFSLGEGPLGPNEDFDIPGMDIDQFLAVDDNFFNSYVGDLQREAAAQPSSTITTGSLEGHIHPPSITTGEHALPPTAPVQSHPLDSPKSHSTAPKEPGKPKRRRIRSTEQQQQNKIAQQKYRERRRQRHAELESAVVILQERVDHLKNVEHDNLQLRSKNEELLRVLQENESEMERLRAELRRLAVNPTAHAIDTGDEQECQEVVDPVIDIEKAKVEYSKSIDAVREFLEQHSLRPGAQFTDDPQAGRDVLAELTVLVMKSCKSCVKLMKENVPCVTDRMGACVSKFSQVHCNQVKQKWKAALDSVSLTEDQVKAILEARGKLLDALRDLYDKRQLMHMQAMGLMLPHPSKTGEYNDPTTEGRLETVRANGYVFYNRANTDLRRVLDSIRHSLEVEMRLFAEFNYKLLHHYLQPVQAASLMVSLFPGTVDALALANTLAGGTSGSASASSCEEVLKMDDSSAEGQEVLNTSHRRPYITADTHDKPAVALS